jgi:spectinomycin phosphotransferase
MLEPPPIPPARILAHLRAARELRVETLEFLPLGADAGTAVFRASGPDGDYFVKLRRGPFPLASVAVPHYLAGRGIDAVIAPLTDRSGRLFSPLDEYSVIVHPFVAGRDAYEAALTDVQRRGLGAALRAIHTAAIPAGVAEGAPRETFAPGARDAVGELLALAARGPFPDAVAAEMAALMRERDDLIRALVARAAGLAARLARRALPVILCHGDLHAGNLHVAADGRVYIVDWDTVVYAPRERDLMFVGAGIDAVWRGAGAEAAFFQGYGPVEIDRDALAYYRCERAVADIAAFGEALLLTGEGGADRAQSLRYFMGAFQPGDAIDVAMRA